VQVTRSRFFPFRHLQQIRLNHSFSSLSTLSLRVTGYSSSTETCAGTWGLNNPRSVFMFPPTETRLAGVYTTSRGPAVLVLALLLLGFVFPRASGQDRFPCNRDAQRFCSGARNARSTRECLVDHWQDLWPACQVRIGAPAKSTLPAVPRTTTGSLGSHTVAKICPD
jgi:hypothetical protein